MQLSFAAPLAVSTTLIAAVQGAVVAPIYNQNFDGYANAASNTDFTENNNDAYVVITESGSDRAFRGRMVSATSASAAVTVTGSEGQDFTVSTVARLAESSAGATGTSFSLAGAGSGTIFGLTEYRLNLNTTTGVVTLNKSGTNTAFTTSTGGALLSALNTTYQMTLSAVYSSPTSAVISVSVSDGTSTFSGSYTDTSAITGSNFGYRIARSSGDGPVSVFFDDFALATVPEPGSSLILGSGAILALARRRRK